MVPGMGGHILDDVSIAVNAASGDIQDLVLEFFKGVTSDVKDDQLHEFAKSNGLEPDVLESAVYQFIESFLGAGRAKEKGVTFADVDQKELEMGVKVEAEHTNNSWMAKRIALDHLAEIPDYYTRLKQMESDAGIKD